MPLEALAEGLLKGIFRLVTHFVVEVVLELAIKGPGYFLVKRITGQELVEDDWKVMVCGLCFWLLLGLLGYYAYLMFRLGE
jgi:hypothetical protein